MVYVTPIPGPSRTVLAFENVLRASGIAAWTATLVVEPRTGSPSAPPSRIRSAIDRLLMVMTCSAKPGHGISFRLSPAAITLSSTNDSAWVAERCPEGRLDARITSERDTTAATTTAITTMTPPGMSRLLRRDWLWPTGSASASCAPHAEHFAAHGDCNAPQDRQLSSFSF